MAISWPALIRKIKEHECIPFLGAGAAFPALPLGACLAKLLVQKYETLDPGNPRTCPFEDQDDLAKVTQWVTIDSGGDPKLPKFLLADLIQERKAPDGSDPNEIHRVLAELPLPLYVTANYDDFMYAALQRTKIENPAGRGIAIESVHQDFCRWTQKLLRENQSLFDSREFELTPAKPVVFHMHGHIARGATGQARRGPIEAMVASEDDYLDFLVNLSGNLDSHELQGASTRQMLPLTVLSALQGNTLLFVGYSLRDMNFRVILRAIRRSLENSSLIPGITVQYAGSDGEEMQKYLRKYFDGMLKLDVHFAAAKDFATELKQKWSESK